MVPGNTRTSSVPLHFTGRLPLVDSRVSTGVHVQGWTLSWCIQGCCNRRASEVVNAPWGRAWRSERLCSRHWVWSSANKRSARLWIMCTYSGVYRLFHAATDPAGYNAVVVLISIPLQIKSTAEEVSVGTPPEHLQAEHLRTSLSLCLCFFFFFDFLCETEPLEWDREEHEVHETSLFVPVSPLVKENTRTHMCEHTRTQVHARREHQESLLPSSGEFESKSCTFTWFCQTSTRKFPLVHLVPCFSTRRVYLVMHHDISKNQ